MNSTRFGHEPWRGFWVIKIIPQNKIGWFLQKENIPESDTAVCEEINGWTQLLIAQQTEDEKNIQQLTNPMDSQTNDYYHCFVCHRIKFLVVFTGIFGNHVPY